MKGKWTRRRLLASMGIGAAGLPFLPLLQSRSRAAGEFPTRLIVFMVPGGGVAERFFPSGSGEGLGTLPQILAPLERHREKLLAVEGLDNHAIEDGPAGGHIGAMGSILTGVPVLESGFTEAGEGYSYDYGFASGPSVDQVIAGRVSEGVPFPSLEAGLYVDRFGSNKGQTQWRMSYSGRDTPVAPENDPAALFERVFGGLSEGSDARQERARRRQSVLDYLSGELSAVESRLPSADRVKLQQHLSGIEELERNLAAASVTCDATGLDGYSEMSARPRILRQHMDVLVQAMACDMTRVGSIQIAGEGRGIGPLSWLGHTEDDHVYQHDWNVDRLAEVRAWYAGELAYLIDRLEAIPEGAGTMMDNTVILWTSGIAKGDSHDSRNLPFLLIGSAGGYFRTGRVVRQPGMAHNHLLTSLCHAMGLGDVEYFGSEAYGRGPLPGLA